MKKKDLHLLLTEFVKLLNLTNSTSLYLEQKHNLNNSDTNSEICVIRVSSSEENMILTNIL